MKKHLKIFLKLLAAFVTKHHFLVLLLVLLGFISSAAWIFWREVYIIVNTPLAPPPLPTFDRRLLEELRTDLLNRATSSEHLNNATYSDLFK